MNLKYSVAALALLTLGALSASSFGPPGGGAQPKGQAKARPAAPPTPTHSRPAPRPTQAPKAAPRPAPTARPANNPRPSLGPANAPRPAPRPAVNAPKARPNPAPAKMPKVSGGDGPSRPAVGGKDRPTPLPGPKIGKKDGPGGKDRPTPPRPIEPPGGKDRPIFPDKKDGKDRPIFPDKKDGKDRPIFPDKKDGLRPRPDRPIRPDINRPIINRPGGDNTVINRPKMNIGDRVTNNTVNNINVNQWNQYNQRVNAGRPAWATPANWNRPWYGNKPAWYWSRPFYNQHASWHNGYWNVGSSPPPMWFGAGAAAGFLLSPGDTFVYSNPYYAPPPPTTVVVQQLDYSRALPAPTVVQQTVAYPPPPEVGEDGTADLQPTADPPPPSTSDPTVTAANRAFDTARESFKGGQYAQAQEQVEAAIKELPSDGTLHEFRSLTLFAQGKYKDAAAGLYAVLAAGPGWDWDTMRPLYPDPDTYTKQLRALEAFVGKEPTAGYGHFLLAYHYLVMGNKDEAVRQFQDVVKAQPDDKLAAALLKALTSNPAEAKEGPPMPGK